MLNELEKNQHDCEEDNHHLQAQVQVQGDTDDKESIFSFAHDLNQVNQFADEERVKMMNEKAGGKDGQQEVMKDSI